jgi:prevent-host-death family protein
MLSNICSIVNVPAALLRPIVSLVRTRYGRQVKSEWQIQKAKAELSALIKAAQEAPQVITRHGEPVAVVLSYSKYGEYQHQNGRQSLFSLLRSWPEFEVPERDHTDLGRDVTL